MSLSPINPGQAVYFTFREHLLSLPHLDYPTALPFLPPTQLNVAIASVSKFSHGVFFI